MGRMSVVPRDHAWTVADLALLPDDGLRYELVDGTLLVSPAPTKGHQRAVGQVLAGGAVTGRCASDRPAVPVSHSRLDQHSN
jgi:hypothetical protein